MKHALKRATNRILSSFGCEICRTDQLETRALARHLQSLFAKLDVRCVLDVGAHLGEYRNFLRERVGYRGLIVSFEPVRRCIETLSNLARNDPRWIICEFALGSENGNRSINVARFDGLSSFLPPAPGGPSEFREVLVLDHTETVEVRTLDAAIGILERQHPSFESVVRRGPLFMKMDTQGYGLEIIKGAGEAIRYVAALQTELSVQPLYEGMQGYRDELQILETEGFGISGMYPVARDRHMRVIELDCVMVRRDGIDREPTR